MSDTDNVSSPEQFEQKTYPQEGERATQQEQHNIQTYPLPEKTEVLKVTGDKVDFLVIAPKNSGYHYPVFPDTVVRADQEKVSLATETQLLSFTDTKKITGDNIDFLVAIPKGMGAQFQEIIKQKGRLAPPQYALPPEEAYPLPVRVLSIVPSERIKELIIVPRGFGPTYPEYPAVQRQEEYPLPDANKPLKVTGDAIDYLVLVPPEVAQTYPTYPAARLSASTTATVEQLQQQKAELQAEVIRLQEENQQLQAQIAEMRAKTLMKLANEIVGLRIEKGLLEESKRQDTIQKLSKLNEEQLNILLEDTKKLTKLAGTPQPQSGGSGTEDERELKKKELRKQLFGHEELPGGE